MREDDKRHISCAFGGEIYCGPWGRTINTTSAARLWGDLLWPMREDDKHHISCALGGEIYCGPEGRTTNTTSAARLVGRFTVAHKGGRQTPHQLRVWWGDLLWPMREDDKHHISCAFGGDIYCGPWGRTINTTSAARLVGRFTVAHKGGRQTPHQLRVWWGDLLWPMREDDKHHISCAFGGDIYCGPWGRTTNTTSAARLVGTFTVAHEGGRQTPHQLCVWWGHLLWPMREDDKHHISCAFGGDIYCSPWGRTINTTSAVRLVGRFTVAHEGGR